jgi:putative ABC transport system permease protein
MRVPMKAGRSGTHGAGNQRMRSFLVATEVAMALMLVVSASLVVQSILRLEHQNLGIRQDHLLTGHYFMPDTRYPDPPAITRFSDQFGDRVRSLPGVIDASVTTIFPPRNGWTQMLGIPGQLVTRIQDIPTAEFGVTDAHFLRTMGIPLLRGRDFAASDSPTSPSVAIISREFERRYFPSEDPVGRQIHIGPPAFLNYSPGANTTDSSDVTIIGVIGDFRNTGLSRSPDPQILVLYSQHPIVNYGFKDIVIRTASEPRSIAPAIRRELHQMDADMPFAQVQTMDELVQQQTGGQRFTSVLLTLFAAAGLILAVVGIYGVVAFVVTQRKHELAVRMAIGASRANVLWQVLKQALMMAGHGALAGLLGSWATERLTSGLLFGVSAMDPLTLALCAAGLLAVSAIASAIPGARVTRIDPARALRQD